MRGGYQEVNQGGYDSYGNQAGGPYGGGGGGYGYGQPQGYGNPPGQAYGPPASRNSPRTSMNLLFFAAACCVIVNSFLAGIGLLFTGQFVDFLNLTYILFAGFIMVILDTPFFPNFKFVQDLRGGFGKYINVVTRVTGKGVCFLFLGSALFSGMWSNFDSNFMRFFAVFLNLFIFGVGGLATVVGVTKSYKLEKVHKTLAMQGFETHYRDFEREMGGCPGGLTPVQFNEFCNKVQSIKWEDADLKLIHNALCSIPAWRNPQKNQPGSPEPRLSREDLMAWVYDPAVVFL